MAVSIAEGIAEVGDLRARLDEIFPDERVGRAVLGDAIYAELSKSRDVIEENKRAVIDLRDTYDEFFRHVNRATGPDGVRVFEIDNDAKYALADILSEMKLLVDQFESGKISAGEFEKRVSDLVGEAQEVKAELADIDGAQFGNVISSIDGIAGALESAIDKAKSLKMSLPGAYVSSGRGDGASEAERRQFDGNEPPSGLAPLSSPRPRSAPPLIGEPETDTRSGGGGRSQSDFEREIASIAEETAALHLEAQALAEATGAQTAHGNALELARTKTDLLAAAQRSGMAVTPQLRAQIDALAVQYAKAGNAADLAANKILEVQNASRAGAQSIADVFNQMASGALSAKDAVRLLILQVIQLTIKKRILAAVEAMSGGGGFGGIISGIIGVIGGGYADGGYTGDGRKFEPAGVVHKGEYVMPQKAVKRIGVDKLAGLHSAALKGYSGGGLVGGAAPLRPRSASRSESLGDTAPTITINAPVTVNASGGSADQNADLAKRVSKEMEMTMRGTVVSEIQKQMRPGNLMNNRRR